MTKIRTLIVDDEAMARERVLALLQQQPDIEVVDDPAQLANGTDPQLARAIKEVQDRIAKSPKPPTRPAPEIRIPKGGSGR